MKLKFARDGATYVRVYNLLACVCARVHSFRAYNNIM